MIKNQAFEDDQGLIGLGEPLNTECVFLEGDVQFR